MGQLLAVLPRRLPSFGANANVPEGFGIKLLQELFAASLKKDAPASIAVSPFSLEIVLAMVLAGAKEETAEEMAKILLGKKANDADIEKLQENFGKLLKTIIKTAGNGSVDDDAASKAEEDSCALRVEMANKIYVSSALSIRETFRTAIAQHFEGLFEGIDFKETATATFDKGQTPSAVQRINEFVKKTTHGKIQSIFDEKMMADMQMTSMILINAVYFKGNWKNPFDEESTKEEIFHARKGQDVKVEMMHQQDSSFIYYKTREYQVLGIPYYEKKAHMYFVLPKKRFGLAKMLANFNEAKMAKMLKCKRRHTVKVSLPKFKIDCSTHHLIPALSAMGMRRAFNSTEANFGGIVEGNNHSGLHIGEVLQKVLLEVNEMGCEATAATKVELREYNLCFSGPYRPPPPPPKFIADHPFAYFLVIKAQNPPQQSEETDSEQQQQNSLVEEMSTVLFSGTFCGGK